MFNDNHRFIEPVFMMTVRGFFFVCLTLCMSMSHADHKPITRVYYYHNMPPYILPDQTGLYGAYLNLLSERLPENDFTLTFLPRGRINWLLENEDLDGIVIGVNPLWFNDSEQEKHVWTSPFELDRDVVIFHKDEQCVYEGPQSLHDKTITFVEGFYLFGISEAIDSNKIDYVGTSSQLSVIRMINARRVEAGVLSEASLYYYLKMDSSLDSVCVASKPQDEFTRHVLIPKSTDPLTRQKFIVQHESLIQSAEWDAVLEQFQLSRLP